MNAYYVHNDVVHAALTGDWLKSNTKFTPPDSVMLKEAFKDMAYTIWAAGNTPVKVIFNDPATIVFWPDGSKTVVKCSKNDTFSKETGLAMAIIKHAAGNDPQYRKIFDKFCD